MERPMHFSIDKALISISSGCIVMIRGNLNFAKKVFLDSKTDICINLPISGSKLIIPYYENLDTDRVSTIIKKIQDFSGIKIRTHDFTGKLVVDLFAEIESADRIMIGLAGLADESIQLCIDVVKKFLSTNKSKRIILVSLTDDENNPIITVL